MTDAIPKDFIERKTEQLLTAAQRSGFFRDIIADAKRFAADGYVWDVALKMSCDYWCPGVPGGSYI